MKNKIFIEEPILPKSYKNLPALTKEEKKEIIKVLDQNPFKYKCTCDWSKDDEFGFIADLKCPVHGKEAKRKLKEVRSIR